MKYYIGDMRYSGSVKSTLDRRPFDTSADMNLEMSRRWNEIITKYDTVYILGNICTGIQAEWMDRISALSGRKVLVLGEYDHVMLRGSEYSLFDNIISCNEIYDKGRKVILCHYPILQYHRSHDPNVFMLYSQSREIENKLLAYNMVKRIRKQHNEGKLQNCGQVINVAATEPYMDYTPRTLDFLIKELDSGRIYNEEPTNREELLASVEITEYQPLRYKYGYRN